MASSFRDVFPQSSTELLNFFPSSRLPHAAWTLLAGFTLSENQSPPTLFAICTAYEVSLAFFLDCLTLKFNHHWSSCFCLVSRRCPVQILASTPTIYLMPRLRMGGAIPPHRLYSFTVKTLSFLYVFFMHSAVLFIVINYYIWYPVYTAAILTCTISGYAVKPVLNGILSLAENQSPDYLRFEYLRYIYRNLPEAEQKPVSCSSVLGRFHCILNLSHSTTGSPDSLVGITICYGLDAPGIESRWGGGINFQCSTGRPRGPILLYNVYRVFSGDKAAGESCRLPTF